MGYFDALTSGSFKTAPDGRKLFFPYGRLGRCYIIDSEHAYERLRRQIKIFIIVWLVLGIAAIAPLLIIAATALQIYVAVFVGAAGYIAYLVWTRFLLRGLQQSNEKLSLEESLTAMAMALDAKRLWWLEVAALTSMTIGILSLIVDSRNWPTDLAWTIVSGIGAAALARRRHRLDREG